MKFTPELKTFYSQKLLARLQKPREQERRQWRFTTHMYNIHRWLNETKIYSRMARRWVVVVGPCDKVTRKPWDKLASKPLAQHQTRIPEDDIQKIYELHWNLEDESADFFAIISLPWDDGAWHIKPTLNSIHYPPGMEPKLKTIEKRRFESYTPIGFADVDDMVKAFGENAGSSTDQILRDSHRNL